MIGTVSERASDDPDAQLMSLVRDGHVDLFNELVRRHRSRVAGLIRRMLGSDRATDDLAQEVFLRAFRARGTYRPTAQFGTWLFAITRNVTLNERRRISRRRKTEQSSRLAGIAVRSPGNACSGPNPVDEVIRRETGRFVDCAISQLPERQQDAIRLVCFHGHSYRSAAVNLGVTEKAIKSALNRAKHNLRELLQREKHWMPPEISNGNAGIETTSGRCNE